MREVINVSYDNPDREIPFSTLVGKTLTKVEGSKGDEAIVFTTVEGEEYQLWHIQDCCESVSVDDICGDWSEIIGSPILKAEENSSTDPIENDPYATKEGEYERDSFDSFTWTFYRITTELGQVVIRWYGSSNGYYSESVTLSKLQKV